MCLFQECAEFKLAESLDLQLQMFLDRLIDKSDYNIQVRTDQLGEAQMLKDAKIYRYKPFFGLW